MDSRLSLVNGRRLSRLRRQDLPEVARALLAWSKPGSSVGISVVSRIGYTHLCGRNFNVAILSEDWEKIEPLVREGLFSQSLFPTRDPAKFLNPGVSLDLSLVSANDRQSYLQVLSLLWDLFPDSYSVSNL